MEVGPKFQKIKMAKKMENGQKLKKMENGQKLKTKYFTFVNSILSF